MRRRPNRFLTATLVLVLIAMLLMLLGGLLDGLIKRSTSAVDAQRADLVVLSSTAEKSFLRSRVTPEQRAQIASEVAVERITDAIESGQLVAEERVAAPRPEDGPELRRDREAHAVVDAVHVPAAVDRSSISMSPTW